MFHLYIIYIETHKQHTDPALTLMVPIGAPLSTFHLVINRTITFIETVN